MSKHLPECDCYGRSHGECALCICDRLRSCEQRVLAEREADGPWFRSVVHQCCEDKQTAYAAALDAAREAVVGMNPAAYLHMPRVDAGQTLMFLADALAAIDALRGQP